MKPEKCRYCGWIGESDDFEFDHKYAHLKTNSLLSDILQGNVERICSGCNRQKGKMTPEVYSFWRMMNSSQANTGPIRKQSFIDLLRQRAYSGT